MKAQTTEWEAHYYGSGTMIVKRADIGPHYYIYGPGGETEGDSDRNRLQCCKDVAAFLNGGIRPLWFADLERITEEQAVGTDGTMIYATGPSIDINPPHCDWKQDDSQEAQNARARLIDNLLM